jgi:hypothetical protein
MHISDLILQYIWTCPWSPLWSPKYKYVLIYAVRSDNRNIIKESEIIIIYFIAICDSMNQSILHLKSLFFFVFILNLPLVYFVFKTLTSYDYSLIKNTLVFYIKKNKNKRNKILKKNRYYYTIILLHKKKLYRDLYPKQVLTIKSVIGAGHHCDNKFIKCL